MTDPTIDPTPPTIDPTPPTIDPTQPPTPTTPTAPTGPTAQTAQTAQTAATTDRTSPPAAARTITLADRIIGEIDKAIRVLAAPAHASRKIPGETGGELVLEDQDRRESARLMRVNHSGEVAAQALYQGQALTARESTVAGALRQAAVEEMDHLAWCEQRLDELSGRPSVLNPLWYAGSFAIGAAAGALGDKASLGFITETERQVEAHLRGHLDRLPPADHKSRAIVDQMTLDEIAHGEKATALGGGALPLPMRWAMRITARLMTRGSYWI